MATEKVTLSEQRRILDVMENDKKVLDAKILERTRNLLVAQEAVAQANAALRAATQALSTIVDSRDELERRQEELLSKLYCRDGRTQPLPD